MNRSNLLIIIKLTILVCFLYSIPLQAQNILYRNDSLSLLSLNSILPNHPVAVFLSGNCIKNRDKPSHSVSFSYSAGNSWRPAIYVLNHDIFGSKPRIKSMLDEVYGNYQKLFCREDMGDTILNIYPFSEATVLRSDAVTRRLHFDYSKPLGNSEFCASINAFVVGGGSFLDFPVNDASIELFHSAFVKRDTDPFGREKTDYNQGNIIFYTNGKYLEYNKNDVFFGTIDIGIFRYIPVYKSTNYNLIMNAGITGGIPLNKFNPCISFTVSISVLQAYKFNPFSLIRFHAGIGTRMNKAIEIAEGYYNFDYDNQFEYSLNIGYQRNSGKGNTFCVGLEFYGESAYLQKDDYISFHETIALDSAGGSYEVLGGKNDWILTTHNQYLSLYFTHNKNNSLITKGIKITEDGNFKRSKAFVVYASNAQDIAIEVFIKYNLCGKNN